MPDLFNKEVLAIPPQTNNSLKWRSLQGHDGINLPIAVPVLGALSAFMLVFYPVTNLLS